MSKSFKSGDKVRYIGKDSMFDDFRGECTVLGYTVEGYAKVQAFDTSGSIYEEDLECIHQWNPVLGGWQCSQCLETKGARVKVGQVWEFSPLGDKTSTYKVLGVGASDAELENLSTGWIGFYSIKLLERNAKLVEEPTTEDDLMVNVIYDEYAKIPKSSIDKFKEKEVEKPKTKLEKQACKEAREEVVQELIDEKRATYKSNMAMFVNYENNARYYRKKSDKRREILGVTDSEMKQLFED